MDKRVNERLRAKYIEMVSEFFNGLDEDVLRTGTNEISIPVVDESGEDNWVVVTVKVPTGSRDGEAYDGYSLSEDYADHVKEKEEKAKAAAEKKAKKVARDAEMRRQKAEAKKKHSAE